MFQILKLFFFWRIGLLIITYLGSFTFPLIGNTGPGAISPNQDFDYWASWAQWDGGHYLDIAKSGYVNLADYAFFPLFPLVVRIASSILGINLIAAGLFISNVTFAAFLIIFFKLVSEKFHQRVAYNTIVSLLVFPTTFFATAYYSESVFLLLTALIFLFLFGKKFFLAAIMASLASATRLIGVLTTVSIFYSYLFDIKFNLTKLNSKFLHAAVAFFGFSIYTIYLFANLNEPFVYLSSQASWQRSVTDPITTVVSYIWPLITQEGRPFNDWLDLGFTLVFLSILILGIRKIPSSLWIFSMLAILIPASSGTLTSMPRYSLASIGAFVIIGQYLAPRPKLKMFVWTASLLLQIFFAVRFINGYWVA